jgi:hypothetical protein
MDVSPIFHTSLAALELVCRWLATVLLITSRKSNHPCVGDCLAYFRRRLYLFRRLGAVIDGDPFREQRLAGHG